MKSTASEPGLILKEVYIYVIQNCRFTFFFACIVMLLVPIPNLTDFISIVSLS